MSDATHLSTETITELRERARREAGPFVDPAIMHRLQHEQFHDEWAEAIIGGKYEGVRWSGWRNLYLLNLALTAEPDRPTPAAVIAQREEGRRRYEQQQTEWAARLQAEADEWAALRARLPVEVIVGHNWTIGHYPGHVTGRDHIVVQADLVVGQLRRTQYQALCETPSRTKPGARGLDPMRGLDRRPEQIDSDGYRDRVPTCLTCLKTAERLALPATSPTEGAI